VVGIGGLETLGGFLLSVGYFFLTSATFFNSSVFCLISVSEITFGINADGLGNGGDCDLFF
jgi:hypothetical protein